MAFWISLVSLAIWIYLLLFRGMFWRVWPLLHQTPESAGDCQSVAAIIPARDEADVIERAVASLRLQNFRGSLDVYVVDDNSSDGTAELAAGAGARLVTAGPLPAGWTGKMWAQSQGVLVASSQRPDFFLFTDADIEHGRNSLQRLVDRRVALASVMVKLRCESVAERLLIPAFVFFFFKLYPPRWISDPKASTAGAAGGCILIRADVLETIGGVAAIRGELIDDCALAARVKPHGPVWLGLSEETRSIRAYGTFGSIWNMVARTAFTQLRHSTVLLAGTVAGMFLTYLAPPLFTIQGTTAAAFAWALMTIAYAPMLRYYGQPAILAVALPLVACFYLGASVHSAIRYWLGVGGQWKGRVQDRRQ